VHTLLTTVAPVFGIMVLGFVAARMRWLDEASVRGLVLFVFNFAIPVLLFGSMARLDVPDDVAWSFLGAFYAGSVTVWLLSVAAARWIYGRDLAAQAIFGMSGAFANLVLLGIPVLLTAFGPDAALPMFLIIGVDATLVMPLTVVLIHLGRGDQVTVGGQLREVAGALLRNPIILGLALGLAANVSGVTIPGGIDAMIDMMGAAAVPTSLFAMGASLAAYPWRGDLSPALVLTTLKLLVHPLLVWLVATKVLGLEGLWVSVAVVLAAMPTAVNTYLFAARYDAAPRVAAKTVLLSSMLAVVTVSALLVLLGA